MTNYLLFQQNQTNASLIGELQLEQQVMQSARLRMTPTSRYSWYLGTQPVNYPPAVNMLYPKRLFIGRVTAAHHQKIFQLIRTDQDQRPPVSLYSVQVSVTSLVSFVLLGPQEPMVFRNSSIEQWLHLMQPITPEDLELYYTAELQPSVELLRQQFLANPENWFLERAQSNDDQETRRLAALIGLTQSTLVQGGWRVRLSASAAPDFATNLAALRWPARFSDYMRQIDSTEISPDQWTRMFVASRILGGLNGHLTYRKTHSGGWLRLEKAPSPSTEDPRTGLWISPEGKSTTLEIAALNIETDFGRASGDGRRMWDLPPPRDSLDPDNAVHLTIVDFGLEPPENLSLDLDTRNIRPPAPNTERMWYVVPLALEYAELPLVQQLTTAAEKRGDYLFEPIHRGTRFVSRDPETLLIPPTARFALFAFDHVLAPLEPMLGPVFLASHLPTIRHTLSDMLNRSESRVLFDLDPLNDNDLSLSLDILPADPNSHRPSVHIAQRSLVAVCVVLRGPPTANPIRIVDSAASAIVPKPNPLLEKPTPPPLSLEDVAEKKRQLRLAIEQNRVRTLDSLWMPKSSAPEVLKKHALEIYEAWLVGEQSTRNPHPPELAERLRERLLEAIQTRRFYEELANRHLLGVWPLGLERPLSKNAQLVDERVQHAMIELVTKLIVELKDSTNNKPISSSLQTTTMMMAIGLELQSPSTSSELLATPPLPVDFQQFAREAFAPDSVPAGTLVTEGQLWFEIERGLVDRGTPEQIPLYKFLFALVLMPVNDDNYAEDLAVVRRWQLEQLLRLWRRIDPVRGGRGRPLTIQEAAPVMEDQLLYSLRPLHAQSPQRVLDQMAQALRVAFYYAVAADVSSGKGLVGFLNNLRIGIDNRFDPLYDAFRITQYPIIPLIYEQLLAELPGLGFQDIQARILRKAASMPEINRALSAQMAREPVVQEYASLMAQTVRIVMSTEDRPPMGTRSYERPNPALIGITEQQVLFFRPDPREAGLLSAALNTFFGGEVDERNRRLTALPQSVWSARLDSLTKQITTSLASTPGQAALASAWTPAEKRDLILKSFHPEDLARCGIRMALRHYEEHGPASASVVPLGLLEKLLWTMISSPDCYRMRQLYGFELFGLADSPFHHLQTRWAAADHSNGLSEFRLLDIKNAVSIFWDLGKQPEYSAHLAALEALTKNKYPELGYASELWRRALFGSEHAPSVLVLGSLDTDLTLHHCAELVGFLVDLDAQLDTALVRVDSVQAMTAAEDAAVRELDRLLGQVKLEESRIDKAAQDLLNAETYSPAQQVELERNRATNDRERARLLQEKAYQSEKPSQLLKAVDRLALLHSVFVFMLGYLVTPNYPLEALFVQRLHPDGRLLYDYFRGDIPLFIGRHVYGLRMAKQPVDSQWRETFLRLVSGQFYAPQATVVQESPVATEAYEMFVRQILWEARHRVLVRYEREGARTLREHHILAAGMAMCFVNYQPDPNGAMRADDKPAQPEQDRHKVNVSPLSGINTMRDPQNFNLEGVDAFYNSENNHNRFEEQIEYSLYQWQVGQRLFLRPSKARNNRIKSIRVPDPQTNKLPSDATHLEELVPNWQREKWWTLLEFMPEASETVLFFERLFMACTPGKQRPALVALIVEDYERERYPNRAVEFWGVRDFSRGNRDPGDNDDADDDDDDDQDPTSKARRLEQQHRQYQSLMQRRYALAGRAQNKLEELRSRFYTLYARGAMSKQINFRSQPVNAAGRLADLAGSSDFREQEFAEANLLVKEMAGGVESYERYASLVESLLWRELVDVRDACIAVYACREMDIFSVN